eukprot:NODE_288_length_1715_cov_36.452771_g259_i0.p1 GENE.NODE_288_length_1715_cov_36.452771_g259_i0~~NODE_288_length_1715_cov_36.452771_g259_i0.p1  ORF type:complete len:255 (-),score=45.26 NODE_288_length_1715_cov_36.452771_g259_i0:304-1068(-)
MSVEDPFFVVKSEVEQAMLTIEQLYKNWKALLQKTNTSQNQEFKWTVDELNTSLKNVEWDLQDLDETISIVESNPHKFQLDPSELNAQKKFITNTRDRTNSIRNDMNSATTKSKMEKDVRDSLLAAGGKQPRADAYSAPVDTTPDENMSDRQYFEATQQETQLLMKQQDVQLDQVFDTVQDLKSTAKLIGTELDDQVVLIKEVDDKVEYTGNLLERNSKKLADVYKKSNDKKSLCFIAFLILIIIVLAILALTI